MSTKKSDLKSELTDLLLGNDDPEKSDSQILKDDAVTIGTPDQTELLRRKHAKAIEDQSRKKEVIPSLLKEVPVISSRDPNAPARAPSSPAAAQTRIEYLEEELDKMRSENQKHEATTSALRAHSEEMSARLIEWEKRYKDMSEKKDLELQLAREDLGHKTRRLDEMNKQNDELESRFEGEFRKIRVRERELQNRLDILKHEGGAVVRHKDELILDLKRQIEKLNYEMENFRKKNQGVYNQVEAQHDRIKRAMKALRVAVSLLDGEEEKTPLKKAE
jgi:hypothetical protein